MLTQVNDIRDTAAAIDTVILEGLENLAPKGVAGPALDAWLSAPIGGEPLYRRLFEPLIGSGVRYCIAEPGRIADALVRLTRRHPCYSYVLSSDPFLLSNGAQRASLPAGGLLELSAAGGDANVVHPTSNASKLIALARMALEGDLVGRSTRGIFEGDLLRGPEVALGARCRVTGLSAVGARSRIESDVTLHSGTIIGESCLIGEGSELGNCLVLDGAVVPPKARLDDVIWFPSR